jgi:hypothetical protein
VKNLAIKGAIILDWSNSFDAVPANLIGNCRPLKISRTEVWIREALVLDLVKLICSLVRLGSCNSKTERRKLTACKEFA